MLQWFSTITCLTQYWELNSVFLTTIRWVSYFGCCSKKKKNKNIFKNSLYNAGRILNRFSKDVGFLDDLLPFNFCEFLLVSIAHWLFRALFEYHAQFFCQLSLRCTAIVLTATSSNPYLIVPALLMTVLFIGLRWYYLKSARDVKRIESIGKLSNYLIG